jgi:chromosome segregation ATPase
VKSWFAGTASSVNSEIITPFSNAEQIIYKYNQAIEHNSLTQQGWQRLIAQCDDGLVSYLTNIKGSTASMSAYSVSLQGNITGYTKITQAMKQYNALGVVSQKEQQNFATAVSLTNTKLGSYLTGLNGAKASLSGYGISLVASTAKTVGLTIATTALNAALTFGISAIITGVVSAFATWINSSKKITEAAEEAKDKISSINDDLKSNTETVENAKQRYAELAQEVENLGQVSQSRGSLSTDEYEEFLDLSNQLAGVFPQLTKGYDDNGNAILDLSGNVDTIVGSLDDLLQKEKDLANQKIMDEFPDVYKGYVKDLEDAESEVESAKKKFDDINSAYSNLDNGRSIQMGFLSTGYNKEGTMSIGQYENWLETLGLTYEETVVQGGKVVSAVGDINDAFTSQLETARKNLQYAEQQLEGEKSSIDSYLNTWLQSEFTYNQIDDSGLQTAVQDMIMNFDFSSLPKDKRNNWDYVSEYLRRNILFAINDVQDDPEISKAISEVFTNQDLTPEEKANYLQQIKDYFDDLLGKDNAISISLQPQIDDTDALQKSIEKTADRFNDSDKIKDFFDTEGINTDEEVNDFNKVTEGINDADKAIQKWNEHKKEANEDTFEISDAETLKQQISDINSAIDSIQSAYDTLNSAVEEYNTNGGTLSIDTIQSLLSLSDEYLACLQVENGQLSLNADAMAQLAQSKLDDAQATAVTQAMTELDTIAKGENSSANAAYISGNAALMSSLAQLSGSYDGVAKAAMTAAQAQRLSALISDAAGKDKTATENVMKGLDTKLKLIQTTKASINAGNFGKVAGKSSSSSKGSGSGKSTSDTAKEEIEAYMEYLEKALEGGRITYSDYVRDVTLKLDDMYHKGRITAKEYFDYVEKRLNQQLEVYKSVLSAVTDLLEDEAQKWQDKIDALNDENDLLEKQKDDYDSILSAVDQVYQDEIDRLNEQKDLLQDKIDAINDENDALELQRKKQEALIALDKARQQRNVKIYTEGRGYFYDIDQDAYKDAQQNLQDIKNEEVIKKLEDEQDALDDSIELLEKYRDLWNDIADAYKKKTNEALAVALWGENYEKLILQNRTQDIESFKDKYLEIQSKIDDNKSLIDSYQEKVDYYNKLKEQWNEISSAYEKEQQRMYAAQILGANWEKDVLDGRLDVLSQFRDQYLEIQRQMTQAALDGARARNDAAASGGTGGSGGSSGGGGGSTPQNQQAYHVLHLVGGYSTSGEASSKISSFNGKGVYKYKDGKWYVYKEEDYSNLSFGSKSEADDYIKKHLSPAGKFLVKYYHNGLENGLVDFSKKDSNFDLVQKYGLKKYEVPAILKQGEAVMNQEQIKNLGEALRAIPTAATLYTTPDYTKMLSSLKTNNTPVMVTQSVNITLPNVTNNSGYENLTRELNRLKLDAYQFANRRN